MSQVTSLKETSESQSKRAEDLNNKLKKVILSKTKPVISELLNETRLMIMTTETEILHY